MTERDNDRHMLDQNSPHVQVFRFADGEFGDKPRAELREHLASAARAITTGLVHAPASEEVIGCFIGLRHGLLNERMIMHVLRRWYVVTGEWRGILELTPKKRNDCCPVRCPIEPTSEKEAN